MKRKIVFLVMFVGLVGISALQSCEEGSNPPVTHNTFTVPEVVNPDDGASIDILSATSVNLQWASENIDGDPVLADVYFGTASHPPLYKANHNALSLTVPVVKGLTYHWYVIMKDKNGIPTDGDTWSFTIYEPIGIFVGDFNCLEPEEAYDYDVNFAKTGDNTLLCDNYWNSGWEVTFTLNFTTNTYSFPLTSFTSVWSAIESGTIDPETGQMIGHYIVYQNGVNIEEGEHTYNKL